MNDVAALLGTGGGAFAALGTMAIWVPQFGCCGTRVENLMLMGVGYSLMVISIVSGIIMALTRDVAHARRDLAQPLAFRF